MSARAARYETGAAQSDTRAAARRRAPPHAARLDGGLVVDVAAVDADLQVSATKKHSYSEDENLLHISYESGELEDPAYPGNNHE